MLAPQNLITISNELWQKCEKNLMIGYENFAH